METGLCSPYRGGPSLGSAHRLDVPVNGLEPTKPSLESIQRLDHSLSFRCATDDPLRVSRVSKGNCEIRSELRTGCGTICSDVGLQCFDPASTAVQTTHDKDRPSPSMSVVHRMRVGERTGSRLHDLISAIGTPDRVLHADNRTKLQRRRISLV